MTGYDLMDRVQFQKPECVDCVQGIASVTMRRQLCAVVLVTVLATWVVSAGPVATVAKDAAGSSIELLMPAVRPQVVSMQQLC